MLLYYFTVIKITCIIIGTIKIVNGGCKMFDFHMHSTFSADCDTPMEDTIERAIDKGFTDICFTEHIDYEYPDPTIQFELDLEGYRKKVAQMNRMYGDRITIRRGVEIGVQPHLLRTYEKLIQEEDFEFILCSMHTTNKQGLHSRDLFKGRTVEEAFRLYYEELLYCVQNFDAYDVLAHVDLVKRYTDRPTTDHCYDIIEEIFKTIIPKGKGIEVNTSGYRYGLGIGMPSEDILTLYKKCGGELITLGSDAHEADTVGYKFKESLEVLQRVGFTHVTTFENREPNRYPIETLKSLNC